MTTMQIDRAVVEQALEVLDEADTFHRNLPDQRARRLAAMTALRAALAQQDEPVATVAENATTQQFVGETPPSDYRRGYWDGFNIGKREGRIEAEDALAQQAEPVEPAQEILTQEEINNLTDVHLTADIDTPVGEDEPVAWVEGAEEFARAVESAVLRKLGRPAEPVQEPVAWIYQNAYTEQEYLVWKQGNGGRNWTPLYTAPPQRKPLTEEEMYSVEEEARKSFRQSQRGVRGQQITYWDGLTPWLIRAVERAHGIKE